MRGNRISLTQHKLVYKNQFKRKIDEPFFFLCGVKVSVPLPQKYFYVYTNPVTGHILVRHRKITRTKFNLNRI